MAQTHQSVVEGGEDIELITRQITATAKNRKTTAVAICPVARSIKKMAIATNTQNQGDSGNLSTLNFMPLGIWRHYMPTLKDQSIGKQLRLSRTQ